MYSENPSGKSMNTSTAARLGATNMRPAHARRRDGRVFADAGAGVSIAVMGLRSTSSTACDNPVSEVAGRDPRSTGPKLRSISAATFSHAGVMGRPSETTGPSVSTARLPTLRCAWANPSALSADRSTGTNRRDSPIRACPTGPVANFTNSHACSLRRLVAEMASPVTPIFEQATRPRGPNGNGATSKSRPSARSNV